MRSGSHVSHVLMAALTLAAALPCARVAAQPYSEPGPGGQVDVGIFYDRLAPEGDWVEMPDYGWSWAPHVERDWQPYTRGQWIMTDDGWYWDSDESFGWAAYHYGRWVNDPYYGWVWVPGTEWAPAWVSWRHGNGYTGWAPLPPRALWQANVGLSIGGLAIDGFIGADDYTFVPDRAFVDRGVYQRALPRAQNVTIINQTTNITNYTVVNRRVFNGGIPLANVERAVGRNVPRVRTVDVDRPDAPRRGQADQVGVFRPEVRTAPGKKPAQGRSLVRGEAPPPPLAARRQEREQERQKRGNAPEATARDVEQRRPPTQPAPKPPRADAPPAPPHADPKTPQPPPHPAPQPPQPQPAQPPRDHARPAASPHPQPPPDEPHKKAPPREDKPKASTPPPAPRPEPPQKAPRPEAKPRQPEPEKPREVPRQDTAKPRAKAPDQPPPKRGDDPHPPPPKDNPKEKGKKDKEPPPPPGQQP